VKGIVMLAEFIYLKNNEVLVTSKRFVVKKKNNGKQTYAIRNITSVSTFKEAGTYHQHKYKNNAAFGSLLAAISTTGFFCCAGQIYETSVKKFAHKEDEVFVLLFACLGAVGSILALGLFFLAMNLKGHHDPEIYFVLLFTSSGEQRALGSKDRLFIEEVTKAIEKAITEYE
jgi:hypothetical protein